MQFQTRRLRVFGIRLQPSWKLMLLAHGMKNWSETRCLLKMQILFLRFLFTRRRKISLRGILIHEGFFQ